MTTIHLKIYVVFWAHRDVYKKYKITKYGSSLYIGMDDVLAHSACTFENSNLHFHFQL